MLLASRPAQQGRHRAPRPSSGPGHALFAAAPRVVGAAALAVAVTGAVTVPATSDVRPADEPQQAQLAGTTLDVSPRVTLDRSQRVSRDSSRMALGDKTGTKVRKPGGGKAKEKNAKVAKLAASAEKAAAEIAENAWQLPIAPGAYRLTARFGQCSSLWSHCHTGLDFAAASGTPIRAIANGVITETGYAGPYGNRTIMTLEDGTEIWYCHQTSFAASEGETVVGGQTIGYVGSTGNSTGPHLHLEVRPGGGDAVDPHNAMSVHGEAP